jgi:hypothetical protein
VVLGGARVGDAHADGREERHRDLLCQ